MKLLIFLVAIFVQIGCTDKTVVTELCGNGVIDPGEECDGSDLNGQSCQGLGFYGGIMVCGSNCQVDITDCSGRCGDGVIEPGEECDTLDLGGQTCLALGFSGGQLVCTPDCRFDSGFCENEGPCDGISADPSVMPEGFVGVIRPWGGPGGLCGPGSEYPTCALSEPYPVGSYTLGNSTYAGSVSTRGQWLSIPITGDGNTYKFEWIQAKPVGYPYNYQPARPTDFKYVTLTTCPGDFRVTSDYVAADPADPSLIQQCRNQTVAETAIHYGPTGFGRCNVPEGETWYLNIIWQDPTHLDPTETGCRDTATGFCETSWKHLRD